MSTLVGSIGGNYTTIAGPLGSGLSTGATLVGTTGLNGLTTFTPTLGLTATAPLGLGSVSGAVVPVTVTYGNQSFVVGLPAFSGGFNLLGLVQGNVVVNLGSIGVENGQLVFVTPSFSAGISTPLGGANTTLAAGTATVGSNGVAVTAPNFSANGNVLGVVSGGVGVTGGSASVTSAGANITGPTASVGGAVGTAVGGTATVATGSATVDSTGATVTGPNAIGTVISPDLNTTATGTVNTGDASVNNTGVTVNGPSASGSVSTLDSDAPSASGSVNSGQVQASTSGASVTGPSATGSATTASGSTVTASADTGAAKADSSGVTVTDTPSASVSVS